MKEKDFLKEIRGKSGAELRGVSKTLREQLMRLRFRKAAGQLAQPSQISILKRNIARIETIVKQARGDS